MQFLQQNQFHARSHSVAQCGFNRIEIGVDAAVISFLHQRNFEGFLVHSATDGDGQSAMVARTRLRLA